MERTVRVAVVQSAPVLFDKASAMQKIAEWTKEAAKQQAQLVVFPETFVSGYPRGFTFGTGWGANGFGQKGLGEILGKCCRNSG